VLRLQSRFLPIALLTLASIGLAGCPERTSIERIHREPGRFAGKQVTIAGHVVNSFGAMGSGMFAVDDGTGRLWVYSERFGIPGRDARVAVSGRIEQGFSFGGRNYATILRETERQRY